METTVNNNPATKRQRFALWLASKACGEPKDFRNMELTISQATELLKSYNLRSGYNASSNNSEHNKISTNKPVKSMTEQEKKQMYRSQFIQFFKEKYLDRAIGLLNDILKIESEVYSADVFGNDLGGKRYKFYGYGCACGWLTFRKCEKYKMIYSEATSAFIHECLDLFIAQIDLQIVKQLERDGAPIGAIYTQDYQFRQLENECVAAFLKKNGAKDVQSHVRLD